MSLSGTVKSLRGEANSSRSSAYNEFASSFLLAMTWRFVFIQNKIQSFLDRLLNITNGGISLPTATQFV